VDAQPFAALDGVRVDQADGNILRLAVPAAAMSGVVRAAARHELVDLISEPAELEEIFLDLYREDGHGS
jgi:hypothetical protein